MFRLYKSPEGIQEYAKIGKKYPEHMQDMFFAHFQQLTEWDKDKKEIINKITRLKRYDNSEWIVYSETSEGHDKIYGKRHTFFRDDLGKYIQIEIEKVRVPNEEIIDNPSAVTDFEFDEDGKPANKKDMNLFREVTNIIGEKEAYSIPFTKANLDDLHKKCTDKTGFCVAKENGASISITGNYEQFRNGSFEVLFNYGCIPTAEQKERIDNISRARFGSTTGLSKIAMEAIV